MFLNEKRKREFINGRGILQTEKHSGIKWKEKDTESETENDRDNNREDRENDRDRQRE